MATVRYGDVVPASDVVESLEEKIKRRRASNGDLQPQTPSGAEQTETQTNEPKKRSE